MYVQYCTQACRVLSFVTVIFIIGFIMVKSDQLIVFDHDKELFAEEVAAAPPVSAADQKLKQDVVTTIFASYLGRAPTATELDAYTSKMSSPTDYSSVMVKLQATPEYKATVLGETKPASTSPPPTTSKTTVTASTVAAAKAPLPKFTPPGVEAQSAQDAKTAMYRKIINTYLNVMDRYPTDQELSYYAKKMTAEPALTIDKLVLILESSREYKIKEKTQTNIINSSLDGIITDAQLTYEVRRLFAQVYGVQLASYETEQFLKQKFVEFQLDVNRVVQLLKLMKQLDEAGLQSGSVLTENGPGSTTSTILKKTVAIDVSNNNILKSTVAAATKPGAQAGAGAAANGKSASCDNKNVTINIIAPSGVEVQDIISQIQRGQLTPNSDAASSVYSKFAISDPLYKRTAACAAGQQRDLLYEYRTMRNADELSASCSRTSYYDNLDASLPSQCCDERRTAQAQAREMPADMSGTPLSGAPLADAANTRVGSIMPSFIYKELPSCSTASGARSAAGI